MNRYISARNGIQAVCGILLLALLSGLPLPAGAVSHVVYLRHPNAQPVPAPNAADDHTYLREIESMRLALTDQAPDVAIPPIPRTRMPPYYPGSLRVTRRHGGLSLVTFVTLHDDNRTSISTVDLVVRDSDLYVLGFINGRGARRTFFRMLEPSYPLQNRDVSTPSTLTWPRTTAVNLPFSYDYPDIERTAGIGRYQNNVRLSMRTLRGAVAILSEYNRDHTDEDSYSEVAGSLLRIVIAYFEGMRFHDIAQGIHDVGIDRGHSWYVNRRAALITNNWRTLTEFGSRTSLESSSSGSSGRDTPSDGTPQRMELAISRNRPQGSNIWVASSLESLDDRTPSWRSIVAVALVTQWGLAHRGGCYRTGHRPHREASLLIAPSLEDECDSQLIRIGNRFYDRKAGYAVLAAAFSRH